jgi:hypothetical protein
LLVDKGEDSAQVNCITQILAVFEPVDVLHFILSSKLGDPIACVVFSLENYGIAGLPIQELQLPKTAIYLLIEH